ncbi:MAG: hypothetical protein JW894_07935 [Bacteroidales bacterium]|nr:hypothetical protein [Bacteroidales bacterium]
MKKLFKILFYIILFLLVILFTVPFLFKGKIITIANEQLEKNLNADASFKDVSLSLFRKFPNLSVRLKGLNISGVEEFEGDTLLNIKSFEVVVDVLSAIKMENIKIKKILLDKPNINAIILESGLTNWDIVPEKEEEAEEEPVDTTVSEFKTQISLKLFRINEANISYTDYSSGMKASLGNFNFKLSGDLSQDFSVIKIDSETEKLNFTMDGVRYIKDVLLGMHFDIDANLKESIYKLNENFVSLNALRLSFDGSIEMPESGDILINLKFGTNEADFKTLLSLVPAIYTRDFADLKTTGKLQLDGVVSGALTETTTPNADLTLKVKNASFNYPDLPKSADNIQIGIDVHYDGVQNDNTTVDVNTFHVDLGDNPVDVNLNLRTPISDPFTNGHFQAKIDLETLADVIPLDDTEIEGIIDANLDWMGKLPAIEKGEYQDFKADGSININGLYYNSPDVPKAFSLNKSIVKFSPKEVLISSFQAKLGESDFNLVGKLTNFIPFVLKDETVFGELSLTSDLINLNEFMAEGEPTDESNKEADTVPLSVVEVPANINFKFIASINKLIYDKTDIEDVIGNIYIKDQRVVMENLSMNMFDGSVKLSGEYNTQDIKNPLVDLKFKASHIDIPMATEAFDVVGKVAPIAKKASGYVTVGMSFSSFLDQQMKPVLKSLNGEGNLASQTIGIKSSNAFNKIGETLKTDAFNDMTLKDLSVDFEIINGDVFVDPFETNMKEVTLNIAGRQSIDNKLDYGIDISAPRELLGLENPAVNNLYSNAASRGINIERSETVNLKAKVAGEMNDPKVSVDLRESLTQNVSGVTQQIRETASQEIEQRKEEAEQRAREEAKVQADKIISEAEKQAAKVKADGKKAADAIRNEANSTADRIIREAGSNPVKRASAEQLAKKTREESEKKAKKVEDEANERADKIVEDAKKRADQLLAE